MSALAIPVSASDHLQGDPRAAVTLVEYGDYQCPACGMAYPVVKQLQRHFGGDLCFVFRNFPMGEAHPFAKLAARVAEASAVLGRFWSVHDWLYENQEVWTSYGAAGLEEGFLQLGIDTSAIAEVMRDPAIDARIHRDFIGGARSGVNGTPGFFVDGRLQQGDFDSLAPVIADALGRRW